MYRSLHNKKIMIFATLLCPPLGFVLALLCLYKNQNEWKTCIFCISYAIAIFAYCYEPTVDSDLVRYHQVIEQIKDRSAEPGLPHDTPFQEEYPDFGIFPPP